MLFFLKKTRALIKEKKYISHVTALKKSLT